MALSDVRIQRGYIDLGVRWGQRQLHYRVAGSITAPALFLLHQTPSHSAMYESLMRRLASRFRVWALDTPGFGQSDPLPGRFTVPAAAAALAAAARLLGVDSAAWFGHHTGAALALQVTHDFPQQVSRLVMSGPCLLDADLRARLPRRAASIPLSAKGSHLQQTWSRIQAKDPAAGVAIWQRDTLAGVAAGGAYAAAYQAVVEVDAAAQLCALDIPTLVFAGTQDPLYPRLAAAAALLKKGSQAEIDGARTFVCERNADVVAELISDFLAEDADV